MVTSDASVIARAADMGINYFDTCRSYQHGNNERLVATGLKGKRQNIVFPARPMAPPSRRRCKSLTPRSANWGPTIWTSGICT